MRNIENIECWKFSKTDAEPKEILWHCKNLEKKEWEKLTPSKWLEMKFSKQFSFGTDELTRNGFYKLQGYNYNFRPYLKKYIVKTDYDGIFIRYAPNVSLLRTANGFNRNCKVALAPKNF